MNDSSHERTRRGAHLVSAGILLSRVFGFVRGWLFARYIGSGVEADAYNAASRIPNVLRNLLGEGAISASFVPVYAAALERGDEKGARALANSLLGVLLVGVSLLTAAGILLAPWLTAILASGFDKEKAALTTTLLRVMFPMSGLMILSGWCLGVQNAHRRFFMAYASAAMWSVPQIALLLFAGGNPDLVELVWWVSWATLAGAVLQVSTQIPEVLRLMVSVRPALGTATPGLAETLRNFVPVVIALGVFQISGLVDVLIASYLPDGAIANLGYAGQLYLLPLALFGVATAAAALPELARAHARGTGESLVAGVAVAWERVLFYTLPSAVAFIGLGDLIVGLLFRSGRFGPEEQRIVHLILSGYALGLVAYASVRVLTSSYQAVQDYRTPVVAAAAGVIVSAALAAAIALPFRDRTDAVAGLAAGSAIGAYVNLVILWRGLHRQVGVVALGGPLKVGGKALAAAVIALLVAFPVRLALEGQAVQLSAIATLPVYCLVFLAVARWFRLDEAERMARSLLRRSRLQ